MRVLSSEYMRLKIPPSIARYSVSTGKVAILIQRLRRHRHLLAGEAAALDRAAEHPVHAAVAVIGAAGAVLAERPAELRQHDDDGAVPRRAHLLGEAGETLTEARRAASRAGPARRPD